MKNEIIDKMSNLITSAFGLVAALAWNGAITALFEKVFGEAKGLIPMLIYAVVVTVIGVIATLWIAELQLKPKNKSMGENFNNKPESRFSSLRKN